MTAAARERNDMIYGQGIIGQAVGTVATVSIDQPKPVALQDLARLLPATSASGVSSAGGRVTPLPVSD